MVGPGEVVLDVCNVVFVGKNEKIIMGRQGRFILSPQMRKFKAEVLAMVKPSTVAPPQRVEIYLYCYHDIDATIETIVDAISKKAFLNADDRDVRELLVTKIPLKKGSLGRIIAKVKTIEGGEK
jgi:Holliday junction resolvase RusA-like endonuclease